MMMALNQIIKLIQIKQLQKMIKLSHYFKVFSYFIILIVQGLTLNAKKLKDNSNQPEVDCCQKVKTKIWLFCFHLVNYLQYDQLLPEPQYETLKQDHIIKTKYPENYSQTYQERSKKFGMSLQQVIKLKNQQQESKNRTFWKQFKKFICCQGGNELEEADQTLTAASQSEFLYLTKVKAKKYSKLKNTNQTYQTHQSIEFKPQEITSMFRQQGDIISEIKEDNGLDDFIFKEQDNKISSKDKKNINLNTMKIAERNNKTTINENYFATEKILVKNQRHLNQNDEQIDLNFKIQDQANDKKTNQVNNQKQHLNKKNLKGDRISNIQGQKPVQKQIKDEINRSRDTINEIVDENNETRDESNKNRDKNSQNRNTNNENKDKYDKTSIFLQNKVEEQKSLKDRKESQTTLDQNAFSQVQDIRGSNGLSSNYNNKHSKHLADPYSNINLQGMNSGKERQNSQSQHDNSDMISVAYSENVEQKMNENKLNRAQKKQKDKQKVDQIFNPSQFSGGYANFQNQSNNENEQNNQENKDEDENRYEDKRIVQNRSYSSPQLNNKKGKNKKKLLNTNLNDLIISEQKQSKQDQGIEFDENQMGAEPQNQLSQTKTLSSNQFNSLDSPSSLSSQPQSNKKKKNRNKQLFSLKQQQEKVEDIMFLPDEQDQKKWQSKTINVSQGNNSFVPSSSQTINMKKKRRIKNLRQMANQNQNDNIIIIEANQLLEGKTAQLKEEQLYYDPARKASQPVAKAQFSQNNLSIQNSNNAISSLKVEKRKKKKAKLRQQMEKQQKQLQVVDLGQLMD